MKWYESVVAPKHGTIWGTDRNSARKRDGKRE